MVLRIFWAIVYNILELILRVNCYFSKTRLLKFKTYSQRLIEGKLSISRSYLG